MKHYIFGDTHVHVHEGYTETRLPGLPPLIALHQEQPGQAKTAEDYGLPVRVMNEGHDLLHSWLSAKMGMAGSAALAHAATGKQGGNPMVLAWEETVVLSLQALLYQGSRTVYELCEEYRAP